MVEEQSKLGFLNRRFGVPLIDGATVRLVLLILAADISSWKTGLNPDSFYRLPALIGLSRAMDMILTGRLVEPKEALDWGLANRVVQHLARP